MSSASITRILATALLALALACPALAQPRPQVPAVVVSGRPATSAIRRDGARVGPSPAARALLRGSVGNYVRAVSSDPQLHGEIEQVRTDSERTIDSVGGSTIGSARRDRALWVPFAANRAVRRGLVAAVLRDMHRRSAAIEQAIDRGAGEPVWDTVIVGGGVHGAATAQELSDADPGRRVLTVEATATISPTFAAAGESFAINSPNRQHAPDLPRGQDNRNPIRGPVQLTDMTGSMWPTADAISDATAIALHTSRSDVLLRNQVERVERAPAGAAARYLVTLRNTTTGARRQIMASNLVVATGLGRQRVAIGDASTNRLVEGEVARATELLAPGRGDTDGPMPIELERGAMPRIMTVAQALELGNRMRAGRDPYRAPADRSEPAPVTAVVGFGDSAKTVVEYLVGQAPSGAYDGPGRGDVAQRGNVGPIVWAVGNEGPTDGPSYRGAVWPRYGRVGLAIESGATQLVRGRVVGVRNVTEGGRQRLALTYDLGGGQQTEGVVDRVILATGFESTSADVLSPLVSLPAGEQAPIERSSVARPVTVGDRTVATRVDGESVFFVGPASGEIVPTAEVGGVRQFLASINANLPRTTAFASHVLPGEPRAAIDAGRGIDASAAVDSRRRAVLSAPRSPGATSHVLQRGAFERARLPLGYSESFNAAVRYEMAEVLDDFRFPALDTVSVSVTRSGRDGVSVSVDGVSQQGARRLAGAIQRNPRLLALLERNLRLGYATTFRARVRPSDTGRETLRGAIRPSSVSVTYGP